MYFREYLCFSSRNINRLMRMRPGIRKIIWGYFILLHIVVLSCVFGFLWWLKDDFVYLYSWVVIFLIFFIFLVSTCSGVQKYVMYILLLKYRLKVTLHYCSNRMFYNVHVYKVILHDYKYNTFCWHFHGSLYRQSCVMEKNQRSLFSSMIIIMVQQMMLIMIILIVFLHISVNVNNSK